MIKKWYLVFAICILWFLCSCSKPIEEQTEPFVLEINIDDLSHIYAIATYVGSETLTIYHGGTPIYFSIFNSDGESLARSINTTAGKTTELNPGDIIRVEMNVFNSGDKDFITFEYDEEWNMEIKYGYIRGEDYQITVYLRYDLGDVSETIEQETSVFIHIP